MGNLFTVDCMRRHIVVMSENSGQVDIVLLNDHSIALFHVGDWVFPSSEYTDELTALIQKLSMEQKLCRLLMDAMEDAMFRAASGSFFHHFHLICLSSIQK